MRLFILEIKKILKTRITWILLAVSLFFSALMAYIPATFQACYGTDENGEQTLVTGVKAIRQLKSDRRELAGVMTPQKLKKAVKTYQLYLEKNHAEDTYELPEEVFYENLKPYAPLIPRIREVCMNPDTGASPAVRDLDADSLDSFYEQCTERLGALMKLEQKDHPAAQSQAAEMYEKVETPFIYYSGIEGESMDYQVLLIFLITILFAVIAAPVFSSDYQTQADDILRCTRHGRFRLGITKALSALCICAVSFLLCLAVWIIISNSLFGWESTKTSVQIIFSVSTLLNMNIGQMELFNMAASLLSLLALICFILFLSSKMKNNVSSLALAIFFCILPLIVYTGVPGAVGDWLRCLLPGGGIGMSNSLLYAATNFEFLHIGPLSIWNLYVIIGASIIEIPLFFALAVMSHCRRRA